VAEEEHGECKIVIKNGDKELQAIGMTEEAVQRILESWHININPASSEAPKEQPKDNNFQNNEKR
jgi:hypothetical protein